VVGAGSRVAYYPPCVHRFAVREFISSMVPPLLTVSYFSFRSIADQQTGLEKTDGWKPNVGLMTANRPSLYADLYASEEQENNEDQHDETQTAAGIVSPATAVGPGRQRPESYQKQDYNKNGQHVGVAPIAVAAQP
jgi:hypothetical protein